MDVILAGTGETADFSLIIFGLAVLFGLLYFVIWFPGWRRRRQLENRDAEYSEEYQEDVGMVREDGLEDRSEDGSEGEEKERTDPYHKSP
ncbi:MAG: hypothetical protein KFF77_04575 [Bacteroidetes bacterium]|nr:hypothetical protein [Bacteroidota bacterium]